jgi:integrase
VLAEYLRDLVDAEDAASKQRLLADPPQNEDEQRELCIDAETELQICSDPADERRNIWVFDIVQRVLAKAQSEAPPADGMAELNDLVRRALLELSQRRLSRYNDKFDREWFDCFFDPARVKSMSTRALADLYVDEKRTEFKLNNVSQKRLDKVVSHIEALVEIVGPEVPADLIDDEIVQNVRKSLAHLPSNRFKLYPGIPIAEAIVRGQKADRKAISATTQGQYLDELKGLLNLAVRRKLISSNPALHVKPLKKDTRPPHLKRLPFTPAQLTGFFTSSFYRSCAPSAKEPYTRQDRDWRFWLPLIMLFSGARPNELAQLRAQDVKQTTGKAWYLDLATVSEDGSSVQVKNESSRRHIPLHDELIKCGLLEFVARIRHKGGEGADLFPTLKPNKYGNRAWYALKRLNEVFLPSAIKVSQDQSLYSLRHNVRDALRRVSAPPDALRAITGWSEGSKQASDHYGDPGNPDFYVTWVNAIAYDELDLSFLHG